MPYFLGYGLPSSLTPERIKKVLSFARSQEREFEGALDENAAFVLSQNDPGHDFYRRIHILLRTETGRDAYARAKHSFEGTKLKRSGRADFFGRLARNCLQEVFDQEVLAEVLENQPEDVGNAQHCRELLARESAWEYLAEFVWALSAGSKTGDSIVDVVREYPEVTPFLEEVQEGLVSIDETAEESAENPLPEEDGEAATLVEKIGNIVGLLDAGHLEATVLGDLDDAVGRLISIAASRENRRHNAQWFQSHLSSWREKHSDAIAIAPEVEDRLAALEEHFGSDDFSQDWLESVLVRYEAVLDIETRIREKRAAYKQAVDDDDLVSVSSLAGTLDLLQSEREAAYAAIDAEPSRPLPEKARVSGTLQAGKRKATAASDVKGDEIAADDGEPRALEETQGSTSEHIAQPRADDVSKPTDGRDTAVDEAPTREPEVPEAFDGEQVRQPAPGDDSTTSVEGIADVVAAEMERGRFGLSYHLALATPGLFPNANAIKLVACNYATDELATVAASLPDLAATLTEEAGAALNEEPDPSLRRGHAALMASAALMPARIAPGGPVAELLLSLETHLRDMPSLWALSKTAADVSMTGIHLPFELLCEDDTVERWTENVETLQKETKDWIEAERRTKLRFQPATRVWQKILEDWEDRQRVSIGHMFNLLAKPITGIDIARIKEISGVWRDNFEKEIDRIDREYRNTAATKRIDGPVRINLRNKIGEAVAFADRWRSLIEARPDIRPDYQTKQMNNLRAAVREHANLALDEIGNLKSPIAYRAKELIRGYVAAFENRVTAAFSSRMRLTDLLNGDLLADPDVQFDEMGSPSGRPLASGRLLRLVEQDGADFKKAAVERAKRGDFFVADDAIDFAARSGRLDEDDADRARTEVETERARVQEKLHEGIAATSNRLDAAYARGVLPTETFEEQRAEIPSTDFSGIDDVRPLFQKLRRIDTHIDKYEREKRLELEKRLECLTDIPPDSKSRIEDAIKHRRFQVAEDYIERVTRGETLPELGAPTDRPFDRFFPRFVETYTAFRNEQPDIFGHILETLEGRGHSGPIDASSLSVDAARDSVRLVETWAELHTGKTTKDKLQKLLGALGFINSRLGRGDQRFTEDTAFSFRTETIANRKIAQLPDFGSRAGGQYRLVTIRGRDTHEAIIREAGEWTADGRPPTLIVFLNILDVDARRALAREFGFGTYHPTIVLDEALVAFLATVPHQRLGTFFDCASAFAFAQPFDPDAAEVPPEMFFGRKDERRKIVAMEGEMTHLVYGGRRLGKTALLANIAREYRARAPDELVLFLDLKGTGTGSQKPTDEFWRLLAGQLAKHGIVSPRTVRPDSIGESVQKWLEEKPIRRILILVDEADDFLDADRRPEQGYRVLAQIKRLMDATGRRFKVVFSGLHNVQRAARDPNTPFAHMGEPVRIGPMLPETDGAEIENLIRGPLEALGYRFASTDSVIRIAAETNYYPALAQQFCKELLRHLRENGGVSGEEGPPFTIPPETVDRVFDSRETRDRIRNLFSWTIHLDPRYEFLTYLIAKQSFNDDSAQPNGVPIRTIRDTALSEWPQGFDSDPSYSTFEVLLEEMVGLGILREVGDRGFAIRTRNLRMLLGNDAEIKRRFSDARNRAPSTFDPAQFRNTLNDKTLSSLTAGQEDRLLSGQAGVGLVFGTRLSGLDRIGESLHRAFEGKEDSPRLHTTNSGSLDGLLRQISRSRKSGIDIVLVDTRGVWNPDQIGDTLDFVAGLDAQNRTIRPVFLGGPAEAWAWLNELRPAHRRNAELRETWLGPCSKDFACRWLRDREAPAYADLENSDRSVDPPWPIVTALAAQAAGPRTMRDAIHLTLENHQELISDVLEVPEAKPALRVFSEFAGEAMTVDDISDWSVELGDEISPEEVTGAVDWASRLGMVHKDDKGYRLDSTYAAGIKDIVET